MSLCPGLGEESLSLAGVGATLFLMQKVLPNGLRQDQLGKSKDNLITTNTLKNWLELFLPTSGWTPFMVVSFPPSVITMMTAGSR